MKDTMCEKQHWNRNNRLSNTGNAKEINYCRGGNRNVLGWGDSCMLFDRYSSHVQDFQDLQDLSVRVFPECSICKIREHPTIILFGDSWGCFLYLWSDLVQSYRQLVLGSMDTSKNLKITKIMNFRVVPKRNRKGTSPNWNRIILLSLWALL